MNKNFRLMDPQLPADDKSYDLLKNLIDSLKNKTDILTSNSSRQSVNQNEMIKKIDKKINEKINEMVSNINKIQTKPKIVDV